MLVVAGAFTATGCSDFLETSSPSVVDSEFVFSSPENARASMYGVYEAWRTACSGNAFGDGWFYALDVCGSDIERHPEAFSNQPGRHYPESLYQNGKFASQYGILSYDKEGNSGAYGQLYETIGKANAVINAIESSSEYENFTAGTPSDLSQLYGEAIVARACAYRELVKYFGDVPLQTKSSESATELTSRYKIYDFILNDLQRVAPLMYRVGENSTMEKNIFSRTFAEGMVGRIALEAAGYQTLRGDLYNTGFYVNGEDEPLQFEQLGKANTNADGAVYVRRSDNKTYYTLAKTYFKNVIDNPGSTVKFHATDVRDNGVRTYDNPYQYFFQQMNDLQYADESIYEYAQTQGTGNDSRSYSYGRPSSGGSSNAFPCKAYGQGRINPAFYFGMFDPKDKRRDVSICVTGSTGKGAEKLLPFVPNSKADGGGISLNKWDECRMATPYVLKQRTSGINGPYMRIAEIYLGYAEACAMTGDEGTALSYLKTIRERSFPAGQANTDAFVSSCGSLFKAIIQERGFEYAGEGDRRWTLIRSGLLPEAIKNIKEMTKAMLDGLKTKGYYTFPNGNTISAYVWTKLVDAKAEYGYRLTTQCPAGKEDDPVLYPGWRGQNDDWEAAGKNMGMTEETIAKGLTAGNKTNLAIKGLFNYIDPNGAEAAALEADGYEKVEYGKALVDNEDEYYTYVFYDYDYESAPVYLVPFTPNVISTTGFTNGYGFRQN